MYGRDGGPGSCDAVATITVEVAGYNVQAEAAMDFLQSSTVSVALVALDARDCPPESQLEDR